MIDPTCSREVIGIVAYAEATGVPFRVTSTFRPGAVTAAGNPSRHGRKLAVDFAALAPGRDTEGLAELFRAFLPVEHKLNELIYAGPQVGFNVKAGKRVGKYAQGLHHDHVHVAVDPGVILAAERHVVVVDSIVAPPPEDTDGREDMAEPVDAIPAPGGGVWVLTRDGGVRAYDTPHFYGSYPGLPERDRQGGPRTFVEIVATPAGGYKLLSSGGEPYEFNP